MKKFLIVILLIIMVVAGIVWAADVKISDMKSERPTSDDYVPYVDVSGMTNRRTTFSDAIINASGLTNGMLQVASGGSMQVVALISGNTLDWTSGASLPYLAMFPVTAGTSSYVLTSRGGGGVNPIWTNAPAGGSSSNVFTSGVSTSGITIYHNLIDFDKTPLFISTDHDNTSGISIYSTVHNGKIGITIYNDAAEWQIKNDGADGGTLKLIRNGVEAFELDATTLTTSGMISAHGNISGETLYSYATNSIGGLYFYTKSIAGKYVLIKIPGDLAADYILTLPGTNGNANEVLTTDGDGILSWSAAGAGDVSKATLDGHTNDGAFSGTSNFALKAALTASLDSAKVSGVSLDWTSGVSLPLLAGYTSYSGTSSFVLTSKGTNSTPQWQQVDKTFQTGTTTPYLSDVTGYVQLQINQARAAITSGSGTVRASSEIGLAMYNVAGSAVTGFVSGTSGALLMSAGSGATPVWGTELNMSIATNQAWEKNRVVIFDQSGILSGATNLQYSGVSNQLDLSGVSLVIQSGTSPTGICKTGQIYLDTDADSNGQLYSCVATGQWKDVDDDGGAGYVSKDDLDLHTNPAAFSGSGVSNFALKSALTASVAAGAVSGVSIYDSYIDYMLIHNGAGEWEDLPVIGDVGASYVAGIGINMAVSGLTDIKNRITASTNAAAFAGSGSGVSDFAPKAALTSAVAAAAFSGTTGFALHTSLAANTLTLSGVSGEATKAKLADHTDAAAFAGSTSGVSNFALKAALTAAVGSGIISGTSLASNIAITSTGAQDFGGAAGFEIPNDVNPTVNAIGEIALDTTGPQVVAYSATGSGSTEWVVSAVTDSISFVISGVTHGKDNLTPWGAKYTGQDDMILWKPPYNIVLKEALGITDSGATVIWNLGNCDSAGANCVQMLTNDIASGSTGNMNATDYYSFANSDVTGYQTLRLNVIWSGVSANNNGWFGSGVTTNFTGTINFWKQRR